VAVLWPEAESDTLLVHLRLAPSSGHYHASGSNAIAAVFVTQGALLLHAVQGMPAAAMPAAASLPELTLVSSTAAGPALRKLTLDSFAVCCLLPSVLIDSKAMRQS
jgi:hypothetical protein